MNTFFEKVDRFFDRIKKMSFIKVLLIALAANAVWIIVVGGILLLSGATFSQHVAPSGMFRNSFLVLPFAAFVEEVLFRWGPMLVLNAVLMYFYRSRRIPKQEFFNVEKRCLLANSQLGLVSSKLYYYLFFYIEVVPDTD